MDDLEQLDASRLDTEAFVVSGWSALEHGDLQGARAALQDLYSADPTHPALPLLAAGIRRVRPKPIPWRPAVLFLVVVAAVVVGVRSWNRHTELVTPYQDTSASSSVAPLTQSAPAEVGSVRGTAGHAQPSALPTNKPRPASTTIDEDIIVRQAIKRFEDAYRSRWGDLAFAHCDVSRETDQATAICSPRPASDTPAAESDRVWTFSLRKAEGDWRITSVQPPVMPHH